MSDSSEPQSPLSNAETAEKSPSQQQNNSVLEKRLALELSRFTAKKSNPNNHLMLLGSADSSVEAAVTSMAAVVQAVQKQQHLTGQQHLALALQSAQDLSSVQSSSSVSFQFLQFSFLTAIQFCFQGLKSDLSFTMFRVFDTRWQT